MSKIPIELKQNCSVRTSKPTIRHFISTIPVVKNRLMQSQEKEPLFTLDELVRTCEIFLFLSLKKKRDESKNDIF